MDLNNDPLDADMKAATIYRNGAFDYSYVCCHCNRSYTDISVTLDHIETHFNDKSFFLDEELALNEIIPNTVVPSIEPQLVELEAMTFKVDFQYSEKVNKTKLHVADLKDASFMCDQHCESQEDLDTHLSEHIDVIHGCKLCDHLCPTSSRLSTHLIEVHLNASKLTCFVCSENFNCKTTFAKHLKNHMTAKESSYDLLIEDLISKCEICVKLEVEECAILSCKKKLLICDICTEAFYTKKEMILHMKQTHIQKQGDVMKRGIYMCDKCNRNIKGKFPFYAHQYEHLIGGDRFDALDDKALLNNLKKFLDDNVQCNESTPEASFGCKICCHLSVKRRRNIDIHILQEHVYRLKCRTKEHKRYPCDYCGKEFTLSHNMMVHRRIHTQDKPYTCSICNKSFSHASYQKYHERVHSNIRPYQCSTCGLSFRSNTKLNTHHKVHSTEIVKCPICNKEFKPHRLNVHMRQVHENEHRPYKCSVCSHAFKTSKTLRTHSFRHSGVKKYVCRFQCNERFISTAARRGHERSKHEAH